MAAAWLVGRTPASYADAAAMHQQAGGVHPGDDLSCVQKRRVSLTIICVLHDSSTVRQSGALSDTRALLRNTSTGARSRSD